MSGDRLFHQHQCKECGRTVDCQDPNCKVPREIDRCEICRGKKHGPQ